MTGRRRPLSCRLLSFGARPTCPPIAAHPRVLGFRPWLERLNSRIASKDSAQAHRPDSSPTPFASGKAHGHGGAFTRASSSQSRRHSIS
jgi:hypothetical protein